MSIKKLYKTKIKIDKLQKINIDDIQFLKLYENICNELNYADKLIDEINYFKPKLKNIDIDEQIYYESLDKLESISNFRSSILSNKINYYKKGLKYLVIMKKFLEKLKKKFVDIEIDAIDNDDEDFKNMNEITLGIENMFNDIFHNNKRINEEFFENYYEMKYNLLKHQNEIKNSPIKVIEIFNNNGKFVKKDISTNFL